MSRVIASSSATAGEAVNRSFPHEPGSEQAERANERTDERIAQHLVPDFCNNNYRYISNTIYLMNCSLSIFRGVLLLSAVGVAYFGRVMYRMAYGLK